MISAVPPAQTTAAHYGVDDTCRTVLAGIFKRIGARVPHTKSDDSDPLSVRYVPGIDMLECLRDLKSLVDRSDRPASLLCLLMEWRVVDQHLAPLLMALKWSKQPEACLLIVRLVNFFVNPIVDGQEEWAVERLHHQRILKRHLGSAIFFKHLLSVLVEHFKHSDTEGLSTDKEEAVKAVIFMIKAIIMIPDADIQNRLGVYGRHEQVFECLYETRMYEFLLCLVGQLDRFGFLFTGLLEIFGSIFTAVQEAEAIFNDTKDQPQPYEEGDDQKMARPVRHGRFAGSVVVQLSTGKELLLKASSQFTTGVDYDSGKRQAFRRRQQDYNHNQLLNRLPEHLVDLYRQAADDFLNSAFNIIITKGAAYLDTRMSDRHAPIIAGHVAALCIFFLRFVGKHGHDAALVASVTTTLAFSLHRHFRDCWLERDWQGAVEGLHFWRLFIEHSANQPADHFDRVARQVFYEYDILRYPAILMTAIKHANVRTAAKMAEAVHVWLRAVEQHTTSRPVMLVGRRKRGMFSGNDPDNDDDDMTADGERVEREFRLVQLIAVPTCCCCLY